MRHIVGHRSRSRGNSTWVDGSTKAGHGTPRSATDHVPRVVEGRAEGGGQRAGERHRGELGHFPRAALGSDDG